eukprot:COSAG01_NODE_142_length_24198_cov_8.924893_4_plen_261_part_00
MHVLLDHTVKAMRANKRCSVARYTTVNFENKHKTSRLMVSCTNRGAKNFKNLKDKPVFFQLIVNDGARLLGRLNSGGFRALQRSAIKRWQDARPAKLRTAACWALMKDKLVKARRGIDVQVTRDQAGVCSSATSPTGTRIPWRPLLTWPDGWQACPQQPWTKAQLMQPPASLRCMSRSTVAGKCIGNRDAQGRTESAVADVVCPAGQELRTNAAAIDRVQGDASVCCQAIVTSGKCHSNTDPAENVGTITRVLFIHTVCY